MPVAPRFSSLIISRPRRSFIRIAPLTAFLLALGVHLATAIGLLISHFLFVEVMQPARVRANDDPPLVLEVPRPSTGGDRSRGKARFGVPKGGEGAPDTTRNAAIRSSRPITRPDALAPPEANRPEASSRTGHGPGPGPGSGSTAYDSLPDGNCTSDCGDDPIGTGVWDRLPDGVYREGDPRLHLPRIIEASRVLPAYPDIARRARVQGSVLLLVVVRSDGSVGAIDVVHSPDPRLGFDLAAIEAVKQWRYDPARLGAVPVSVQLTVMVEFVISR